MVELRHLLAEAGHIANFTERSMGEPGMGICAEAPRMERGLQSACSWEDDGEARLRARHRLTTSRTFACGLKSNAFKDWGAKLRGAHASRVPPSASCGRSPE